MSEQKPVEKENIFISSDKGEDQTKHSKTKYVFNGEEYYYLDENDDSNAILRNFQNLTKNDTIDFKIRFYLYKLVDDCKEPFLQILLNKEEDKMTFPQFQLSTGEFLKSTDINSAFRQRCCAEFLKVINTKKPEDDSTKVESLPSQLPSQLPSALPSMFGGSSMRVAEQCYRGFLEEPENTIYVLFDCTHLHVDIDSQRFWGILDEIVNEKHIFRTPIDKDIYNMIQNHEFIAYIKDKKGERINMPCCLYLCRINEQGEYDNAYHESEEHNMKHKSLADSKMDHDTFGHFYYFTTDPIHKDNNTLRLKRYSVFIDNALYVLNINKPIEEIDFGTDDEDDFDETHKSYKDYTCIYFFEDGIQLWCIKSLSRFVAL